MKRILIAALFIPLMACVGNPETGLRGEYPTAPDWTKIYLTRDERTDSVEVKNGKFRFDTENLEPGEYLLTRAGKDGGHEALLLYLDECDTRVLLTDDVIKVFGNTFIKAVISGNPTDAAVRSVNDMIISENPLDADDPAFAATITAVAGRGDMASAIVMWKYAQYCAMVMNPEQLRACLDGLSERAAGSVYGVEARENITRLIASMPGEIAPDFTLGTPDGGQVTLSEFLKGKKLVLIDFWASWCGPCREENPKVKAVYEKYHDLGFDVIGVSMDSDPEAWKKAIADDGLPWTHVSELNGRRSAIGQTYNFSGIPHFVLLDSEGRIIARGTDVRSDLDETVRKYLAV